MIKNAELHAKSKQAFYNYVLGYPFQDVKLQMSDADIENIGRFPEPILDRRDYALISVGIDWGVKNSIVVMGMRENGLVDILNVTQTNSEGAVSPLGAGADIQAIRLALMNYKPDIIVADVGDHGNRIAELMKVYGSNKVYGGKYSSNPTMGLSTASNRIVPSWSDSANLVTMDKLVENKRLIDIIKQGEIGIWKKHDEGLLTYIDHWKNVVIRDEEQDDGSMRQVIGRKGGDHYAQASVLAMVGLDHLREQLYGNSSYDFAYADLDSHLKPEKTDLAKGLDNNIFG